jgi:hypothetical protein
MRGGGAAVVLVSRDSAVKVVYGGGAVGDGGRHGLTIFSWAMEDAIYRMRDA